MTLLKMLGGVVLVGFLYGAAVFVWFVWRGDKTADELPRWYVRLRLP